YTPDSGNYNGSSSSALLHVNRAPTAVTLDVSTITYNEDGTATVTVKATTADVNPEPIPAGDVTLTLNDHDGTGVNSQTGPLDASGQAQFTILGPDVSGNPYHLTASYAQQGDFEASSSTVDLNSNQSATTVSISAPAVTYNADGVV